MAFFVFGMAYDSKRIQRRSDYMNIRLVPEKVAKQVMQWISASNPRESFMSNDSYAVHLPNVGQAGFYDLATDFAEYKERIESGKAHFIFRQMGGDASRYEPEKDAWVEEQIRQGRLHVLYSTSEFYFLRNERPSP
ncbi:MAG: hypothetical protein NTX50_29290 [Candidatus Sumerlaeota bacterium]|nr:hypothetical protein [Candidatus Sumerlaeota bacterium]